jgi:hypothetical protein
VRLVDRTLECVVVSQQLAFGGVLPWALLIAMGIEFARGDMSLESAGQFGAAIAGSQLVSRIRLGRTPQSEDHDDR